MATHTRTTPSGTWYKFDSAGEGIPMHSHSHKAQWHDIRCLKGSVAVYGDMDEFTVSPGETASLPSYRQHEIVALVPNTEIVNGLQFPEPTTDFVEETSADYKLLGRDWMK